MRTAQGRALVERHRRAQATLSRLTLEQMLRLWPVLVAGGRVDENAPAWIRAAVAVIAAQRLRSAALAAQFATAYRMVELGPTDDLFTPSPVVEFTLEAVQTSLSVMGPVAYRREIAKQLGITTRDVTPTLLRETRLPPGIQQKLAASAARAAQRHVLNGARETIDQAIREDPKVRGYMRITDGDPCWFCAMLASRGPVYDDDSFEDSDPRFQGPGDQKVHDACGCMLVPMFFRASNNDPEVMKRYAEYDALWQSTKSRLAFRRAYEAARGQ